MERVKFLYAEVKVYPASVESKRYTDGYDWDTLLIAKEPVLVTYENLLDLWCSNSNDLRAAITKWINNQLLEKGRELIYQNCPEAPEE